MLARTLTMIAAVLGGAALSTGTACGSSASSSGTGGTGGTATAGTGATGGEEEGYGGEASWEVSTGSGGCNAVLYEPPVLSSPHVDACSDLTHLSNPPTSGPHYGSWAHFQNYDEPVPRGFLIHAMEHGAILFLYNCEGCDAEITAIHDYIATKPLDPACIPAADRRVIASPAPWLDVPFAVAAWGFMLKADCFDPDQVDAIYDDHYAQGPEDLCASGIDPFDPNSEVPSDCPL